MEDSRRSDEVFFPWHAANCSCTRVEVVGGYREVPFHLFYAFSFSIITFITNVAIES